jgi:exodeoxyribonuclease VII large subunit
MQPDGIGALNIAFEQLKAKLEAQGLFDDSRKKKIPDLPERVGVITSPTGAAVRDIINVLGRRFPLAKIVFYPVQVQGPSAAGQIADAINLFNEFSAADVLIVGRGGGSIEDLWAFNEESVARAIYNCKIPVISAVGHETDFTIADFVADLRAPTPSAAAELAVPDIREQKMYVSSMKSFLENIMTLKIDSERNKIKNLVSSKSFLSPSDMIKSHRQYLDSLIFACESSANITLKKHRVEFSSLVSKLDAMSPLKVLTRGYAMAEKNNSIVTSVNELTNGDEIVLNFADGKVNCEVK